MNEPRLARPSPAIAKKAWRSAICGRSYTRPQPQMKLFAAILISLVSFAPVTQAQPPQPEWCRTLPNAKYKTLHRIPLSDTWFEVYEVSYAVFCLKKKNTTKQKHTHAH